MFIISYVIIALICIVLLFIIIAINMNDFGSEHADDVDGTYSFTEWHMDKCKFDIQYMKEYEDRLTDMMLELMK